MKVIMICFFLLLLLFFGGTCFRTFQLKKYYPDITFYEVMMYGNHIKIEPDGR